MKLLIWIFGISLLLSLVVYPQTGPGKAVYPETAAGASYTYFQYHTLRWQNPPNTIYNKIYLSYDSAKVANMDPAVLLTSGYPGTVYDSVLINQQLYYPSRYFWCVSEYGSSGSTQGDVWSFTTTRDNIDYAVLDDFAFGTGKWNIQNTTTCGWQISGIGSYTLPAPASGKVLTADVSLCGGPINSTAYFQQIDTMSYMYYGMIQFDSDWQTGTANDAAYVLISTDGGSNWTSIWQQVGVSSRNQHISLPVQSNYNITTLDICLRTLQYGTGSWWSIDNFTVTGDVGILTHIHPLGLKVNSVYSSSPTVKLSWAQILPLPYQRVERKTGLPTEPGVFQTIASMQSSYTMVYIDSTVTDSTIYTYRIGSNEGAGCLVYSNEATAYIYPPVPVELISFTADNFGNRIHLNWITATEVNNKGFDVERKVSDSDWETIAFIEGHGTTTEKQYYSYKDYLTASDQVYYRLKQIDFDGSAVYSDAIEVNINPPDHFSLNQNYPNPFNPRTTITYSLPENSKVVIKVFDMLGNEIETLVNEEKPAGSYQVNWNAGNLPSGIYFYRVQAVPIGRQKGSFTETRKMILMK